MTRPSVSARCRAWITETTDWDEPLNTDSGFWEAWSVMALRRSRVSTVRAGGAAGLAEPAMTAISRIGSPTKNRASPANTPATVIRNCFIDRPARAAPKSRPARPA